MEEAAEIQKQKIVQVLLEIYPRDLPVAEIAKEAGMHRHTAPKYLRELKGEGKVIVRIIGKAALYGLSDEYFRKNRKGRK